MYIIALAVSDLLCATVDMPLASAVLITGRLNFGDAVCQIQGFVDAFVVYSTPATMGLLAFNRYIRIVKTNHYDKIFSPRKSKVWLSCVWLSLALYLLIGRVTNWSTLKFFPGFAVCSDAFTTPEKAESSITVSCSVCLLFYRFPSVFSVIAKFTWKSVSIKLTWLHLYRTWETKRVEFQCKR